MEYLNITLKPGKDSKGGEYMHMCIDLCISIKLSMVFTEEEIFLSAFIKTSIQRLTQLLEL